MNVIRTILGPKSKYEKNLPFTYEARLPIIEGEGRYSSFFSDTICGLIDHLNDNDVKPDDVKIYEIYEKRESLIDVGLYTNTDKKWIFKPELCRTFEEHYKGHIHGCDCSFKDRDRKADGPYV